MISAPDLVALDVRRRAAVRGEVSLLPALETRRTASGVPLASLLACRSALTPPACRPLAASARSPPARRIML
eukprot:3866914-Rhodomonas_salina.1